MISAFSLKRSKINEKLNSCFQWGPTLYMEKAMATHSSTLVWKIPWMEEPGGLQPMGSRRVGHDWVTSLSLFTFHFNALEKEMATHSSVLAWRISGMEEPGGLLSIGSHRVGHDWSDLAAAALCTYSICSLVIFNFMIALWEDHSFLRNNRNEVQE